MIIIIIAVICAYIIKGMCGFANTLIFSTIMSFSTSNINISPVELIVGYPSNIFIAWKERKELQVRIYLPIAILVVLGGIPGALFLKNGNAFDLKIIFGLLIVFIGAEMLFRERQTEKKKNSKVAMIFIGVLSGIICGLFGIGAFLAAYISRTTEKQSVFRGNLCMVFLIENTFRIILYLYFGILNFTILKQALMLMPFMILGLAIGTWLSQRASEKIVKSAVCVLLILSGISLVINNITF